MGFPRPRMMEWGCHFLLQGDLPNPGIEPTSLASPALAGGFFKTEPPGKPSHHPTEDEIPDSELRGIPPNLSPTIESRTRGLQTSRLCPHFHHTRFKEEKTPIIKITLSLRVQSCEYKPILKITWRTRPPSWKSQSLHSCLSLATHS